MAILAHLTHRSASARLWQRSPSPVVVLSRPVAQAHTGAPEAALSKLSALEANLGGGQPANKEYARAITLTTAPEEQAFLRRKQQDSP